MTKKSQNFHQHQNVQKRNSVESMSMDDLALLQDADLDARAQMIRDEFSRRGFTQGDSVVTRPYEVELAYIERELQIRQTRRLKHRQYLAAQEADMVDESTLPEFKATPPNWI